MMRSFAPMVINFSGTEAIATQGGALIPRSLNAFAPVAVTDGILHGTQTTYPETPGGYNDSYALIAGDWGDNYELTGIVYRDPAINTNFQHEIELNVAATQSLPGQQSPEFIETLFSMYEGNASIEQYPWHDADPGDAQTRFEGGNLLGSGSLGRSLVTGDAIRVRKVGSTVTAYVGNLATEQFTQYAQATNIYRTAGQPCVAFFNRPGSTPRHFGLSQLRIRRLPIRNTLRAVANLAANVYPFSFTLPAGSRAFWLQTPRTATGWQNNETTQIRIKVECSFDGGLTWKYGREASTGGVPSTRGYEPGIALDFYTPQDSLQIRGEIQTYRTLRTSIVLDVI